MAKDFSKKSNQITRLIGKYFRNELSGKEAKIFVNWLLEDRENCKLLQILSDDKLMHAEMIKYRDSAAPGIWEKVRSRMQKV